MIRSLLVAASLAAALPGAAIAQPDQSKVRERDACFNIINMQGDRPVDDHTVLFRVNVNEIFELKFANRCPELTFPDPRLIIIPVGGQSFICHAIDLDIKVGQNGGPGDIPVPCIPTSLRRLTPAEVAALPKKDIP